MANRRGLCLNPRGTLWANDQNKFGQKMLEKMGWKLGQGLGAREDGVVDPIRIPYKNDTKGLGCVVCPDPWLNNQESFNDLLSQLNGNVQDCPDAPLVSSSLTEKSKNSRKRVHYHKFARSKDLSCRSLEELASVLGDKNLMKINLKKVVQMDCDTDDVVQTTSEDEEVDERHRRKDKLRKKKLKRKNDKEINVSDDGSINKEELVSHRKKKKKKKAHLEDKVTSELESEEELASGDDGSNMKSLKKTKCNIDIENEVDSESSTVDEAVQLPAKKKSKKSEHVEESCTTMENTKCSSKRKNKSDANQLEKPELKQCGLDQSVESDEDDIEKEQSESEVQKQQNSLQNDTDNPNVVSCKNTAVNWEGIKLFKGSNLLSLRGYGNDVSLNGST